MKALELTGQKFGRLTVIRRIENNRRRQAVWLCKCDCGNNTNTPAGALNSGNTKSCGCLAKEKNQERLIDLTGQRFGSLVVKERDCNNRNETIWICECDCGNICKKKSYFLRNTKVCDCGCLKAYRCRYRVNHNFFKIWTSEMSYILGFWTADGCVIDRPEGHKEIKFTQTNKPIIEKIQNCLGSEHSIYCYKANQSFTLSFSSDEMNKDLCNIFNVDSLCRKSLIVPFPNVDASFARHFVRGCIDGDGCLDFCGGIPRIQFCSGSVIFRNGFLSFILDKTGIEGKKGSNHGVSTITYNGIKAKCLAFWMYNKSIISLERKSIIAEKFFVWKPRKIQQRSLTHKMCQMFRALIPHKYRDRYLLEHAV